MVTSTPPLPSIFINVITLAEYFADIAQAYREELADLYSVGCRNIQVIKTFPTYKWNHCSNNASQFDDPMLAYFCAESMLKGMKEDGT